MPDPIGVGTSGLDLTWRLIGQGPSAYQSAFQVAIHTISRRGKQLKLDTGKIHDPAPRVRITETLDENTDHEWRVRVWDANNALSEWSSPSRFGTGLSRWPGKWIAGPKYEFDRDSERPLPLFRRSFQLDRSVSRARLYATALGLYRLSVNGQPLAEGALAPGWTDYRHRVPYQAFDVSEVLQPGENVVGAVLAEGWYSGHIGIELKRGWYGETPVLSLALLVDYEDDGHEVVLSDQHWLASNEGPWRNASLLLGSTYDGRREPDGWDAPGFDSTTWDRARVVELEAPPKPVPAMLPIVQEVEAVAPLAVTSPNFLTHVFDFGQNLTGVVRFRTRAVPEGTEIQVRHGEILDGAGMPYVANLRLAESIDRYVTRAGSQTLEPEFTVHGFRYAAIFGLEDPPETVEAVVRHTPLRRTGRLSTDNSQLSALQSAIEWGARSNMADIPTDCPQRNERLGWLGDARIFFKTAWLNFDVEGLYRKWLEDVRLAQTPNGMFPDFAPALPGLERDGAPGWADAGVLIPWALYEQTGDHEMLRDAFPSIAKFVQVLHSANPDGIRRNCTGMNWGDWLSVPEPDSHAGRGGDGKLDSVYSTTDLDLFATAFMIRTTDVAARVADLLDDPRQAAEFKMLADRSRRRFREVFVDQEGVLSCPTQTAYALALSYDLVPDRKAEMVNGLLRAIEIHEGKLSTGTTGTELLLDVLSATNHEEIAFDLLHHDGFPSWLWMIKHGATTIWERWDSWTPQSGAHDPRMNSFNHPALGSVGAWMYKAIGGINALEPGFRRVEISPRLGPYINKAVCVITAPAGRIAISVLRRPVSNALQLHLHIPPGVTALVSIDSVPQEIHPGCHRFELQIRA